MDECTYALYFPSMFAVIGMCTYTNYIPLCHFAGPASFAQAAVAFALLE